MLLLKKEGRCWSTVTLKYRCVAVASYLEEPSFTGGDGTNPSPPTFMKISKDKKQLQVLRGKLDSITEKLLALVRKRSSIVAKIGKIKKRNKIPILDRERERQVVHEARERALKYGLDPGFAEILIKKLMFYAKKQQKK